DHLNGQAVFRIGAGKEVLYEKLLAFQIIEHTLIERVKLIERERLVRGGPSLFVLGERIFDGELVFGRTASAFAGLGHQRASRRQFRLASAKRRFHQQSRKQVAVYFFLSQQLRYFGSLQNGGHKRAPNPESK